MKNSNDSKIQNEITNYLKMDLDSLYQILGQNFASDGNLIFKGKLILAEIDQILYQKICNEMEYCKNKLQFNYMDTKKLARLLISNLDEIQNKEPKIPTTLLAVMLVKIGLSRFCKC